MEKLNLCKLTTLNSFNRNISSISPKILSPKFKINNSTLLVNKNLKLNLSNEAFQKFSKLSKFNNSTSTNYNFYKFNTGRPLHHNISYTKKTPKRIRKELSVAVFQNNDVELVRNLNPDSDKDLCSNMLLKEKLKNRIESKINISLLLNPKNKIRAEEKKFTLPKINFLSMDYILENYKNIKNLKKELKENNQTNLLEKDLNKKLKQINDITSLKKKNKSKIYDNFKKIIKEIDNVSYDTQLINPKLNGKNFPRKRESCISLKKGHRRPSFNLESLNNSSFSDNDHNIELNNNNLQTCNDKFTKLNVLQSLYRDQKKKDFEARLKQDQIGELKKELKQLKLPLKSINNEINELKTVEKNIKQRLMRYYQELLYNGKEIRNEGLIWIIKAIWRLGENVPMSFMPAFLDFYGIKYLFNMARLSVELDSKKKFVIELKLKLKRQINNSYKNVENNSKNFNESINKSINDLSKHSNKMMKTPFSFKSNLLFKNKKLTNSSSQPQFMKTFYHLNKKFKKDLNENLIDDGNEEIFTGTIKEVSKIFEENDNFIFINSPAVIKIKNLEKKIKEIEAEIKYLKQCEIKRIFKEYIDYDYENKYHAPIDVVLGALIGEQLKNIQVNEFNIFKKGYFDEIKNIRFYEFAKKHGWVY